MFRTYDYFPKNVEILVVDSDFQAKIAQRGRGGSMNGIMDAIVRIYESKNLPVVRNVILYFVLLGSWVSSMTIKDWIEVHKTNIVDRELWNEFYAKYGKEFDEKLDKYLILL